MFNESVSYKPAICVRVREVGDEILLERLRFVGMEIARRGFLWQITMDFSAS
jgi:hypothetical protein